MQCNLNVYFFYFKNLKMEHTSNINTKSSKLTTKYKTILKEEQIFLKRESIKAK